jgi:DNA-binding response OmpR family regulator
MEKILIVEDEMPILTGLKDNLEMEGYQVFTATDGKKGLQLARDKEPELIILDLMLPKMSGFDVLKALKEERNTAYVIILSAKKEKGDKLDGFDLGADDYITKPFGVEELLARVRAVLRRHDAPLGELKRYKFADIRIDFEKFEATRKGKKLDLTPRELQILKLFIENRGRVISRNELLNKVWGYEVYPTTRTVDNHIVKLRKQLEEDAANPVYITSIRGVGYKFNG